MPDRRRARSARSSSVIDMLIVFSYGVSWVGEEPFGSLAEYSSQNDWYSSIARMASPDC